MAVTKEGPLAVNGVLEGSDHPLCDRCHSLGLNVERFIINPPSAALQPRGPYEPNHLESFSINTGRTYKDFASFHYIYNNRANCSFCRLIYGAMHRYSGGVNGQLNVDTTYSLQWEIHGQEHTKSGYENKTRRMRLYWKENKGHTQEVFLLLIAPKDPLRPNSDAASWHQSRVQFLGRDFSEQKRKQALIKSWIDMCDKHHGKICGPIHGDNDDFVALTKETYFGVIDVTDMQLKSLPHDDEDNPMPFVALSYVWGKNNPDQPTYVTNRRNIMAHTLHGGLEAAWDKLPKTLQDAIRLVSLLNYRYVWIDSLCIVQDSHSSWELNAKAMHLVYGHAAFTICAADGDDATSGLVAMKDILTQSNSQGSEEFHAMSEDVGNKVRLMVTRPLEAVIGDSCWNQRAWTFQERILSRRCVIFADEKVYFECRRTNFSQDVYADAGSRSMPMDRSGSSLPTLSQLDDQPFRFYLAYVRMYTGRQLTKPQDILVAYRGIDSLLSYHMKAPSIFGLPASHFDLSLLWNSRSKIRRRSPRDTPHVYCTQDAMGHCSCRSENSFDGTKFPAWSWSGWMGGTIDYDGEVLEGCLVNVHQWLRQHTWIQWYVRDKTGHLVPISNFVESVDARDRGRADREDTKWNGYCAAYTDRFGRKRVTIHRGGTTYVEGTQRNDYPPEYAGVSRRGPNSITHADTPHAEDGGYENPPATTGGLRQRISSRNHEDTSYREVSKGDDYPIVGKDVLRRRFSSRDHQRTGYGEGPGRVDYPTTNRVSIQESSSSSDGSNLDRPDSPDLYFHAGDSSGIQNRGLVSGVVRYLTQTSAAQILAKGWALLGDAPRRAAAPLRYIMGLPRPQPAKEAERRRIQRDQRRLIEVDERRRLRSPSQPPPSPPPRTRARFPPSPTYPAARQVVLEPRPPERILSKSRAPSPESSTSSDSSSSSDPYEPLRNRSYVPPPEMPSRRRPPPETSSTSSGNETEFEDRYGRAIDRKARKLSKLKDPEFRAILPDNPFKVICQSPSPRSATPSGETLDFMPILQFFTWRTELCVSICESRTTGLCSCDILDKAGDWCGSITLDEDWIRDKDGQLFYFIALSDAKSFTLEECPIWTYYIPKEREKSEWDLYFVLLLERNYERGLWERVGLGKVFQAAFREQLWDEIKLG